ncbi:hypothetical protein [Xanthobacter autotrophicus]|uniref:hypothetical protein n=1 Tax=Xanthobacter autotrophicus TaxID=280 RepID=UPI0012ED1A17
MPQAGEMQRSTSIFSHASPPPTLCRCGQDITLNSARWVAGLAKRAEAHIILPAMSRTLRSLILLLAAIVFALSGVGGGFVGARSVDVGSSNAHHMHVQSAISQAKDAGLPGMAHGDYLAAAPGEGTLSATPTSDKADHDHVGGASSCCAMACHMVIPVVQYSASLALIGHAIGAPTSDHEAVRVLATRLERPPRAVTRANIG